MENFNFWDCEVWGAFNLVAVLLGSLLAANSLKKLIPPLKKSLIPSSVMGGIILMVISLVYEKITGTCFFDIKFFGGNGNANLQVLTYHCLALGFIATTLKSTSANFDKKRNGEILNTGITTVATYLLQGILGLGITLVAAYFAKDIFGASGVLLPFGYGQGTGQALNYGNIYEQEHGFLGGRNFGLSVAALGFLSAAIGGVINLNILKKRGRVIAGEIGDEKTEVLKIEDIQKPNEIPMNGSIDKLTMQLVLIFIAYLISYGIMALLGYFVPALKSILYGFNFLIGVLTAVLVRSANNFCLKKKIVKRQHISPFLMTRLSGFFFDIMIVAGVAAIRINVLKNYWIVLLVLGVVGAVSTYWFTHFISRKFFPDYSEEQFMVTYGMLTGTASTGIILLREIDPDFATPAADNLVYQNFPAMIFGFPMMLLAAIAPEKPVLTMICMLAFFTVMMILLFRKSIFKKKEKSS